MKNIALHFEFSVFIDSSWISFIDILGEKNRVRKQRRKFATTRF